MVLYFDPAEASQASQMAAALGFPEAHFVFGGFEEASQALLSRSRSPAYIVVDIAKAGPEILQPLDDFAEMCEPDVRVVIIGEVNDVVFYRELMKRGVLEYFMRPAAYADVRRILFQRVMGDSDRGDADGTVISFMSAASGDGASTVALNVAYCLAKEHQQPTVLVDLDYQFGMIAKNLDLQSPFGIKELFEHPERGIDSTMVSRMLVKYVDNLFIIAAPSELRPITQMQPEIVRDLIMILKTQFAFVVVDLPHIWTSWTAVALTNADHCVLVSQLWLRSVTHATRLLRSWEESAVDLTRVSLVINRSGAKFKEAITSQDFERVCGHMVNHYLANDIKTIVGAENQGKTLIELGASLLEKQLKDLTVALMKKREKVVAEKSHTVARGSQYRMMHGNANKPGLLALFHKK